MAKSLNIAHDVWTQALEHLSVGPEEQLVFLAAHWSGDDGNAFAIRPIERAGFDIQLPWHLALADDERARVIKWAHDLSAALVEVHVHRGNWPAQFSPTDLTGLYEFVPHVMWRLKHRPYTAIVTSKAGLDALGWFDGPERPERLDEVSVGGGIRLRPTGLSQLRE